MLWRVSGKDLPVLYISADCFDDALKIAREKDEYYNTGQVVEGEGGTMHIYGMRSRGCSPGAQPKNGLDSFTESTDPKYYDILYYNRKLTEDEVGNYELDYLGQA